MRALPVIRTRYCTIYAYDEIAHVRVPPGYADHPEDERIILFPHTHEPLVLWRFIIIIVLLLSPGCPQLPEIKNTKV